jgi:hypothetical protein
MDMPFLANIVVSVAQVPQTKAPLTSSHFDLTSG